MSTGCYRSSSRYGTSWRCSSTSSSGSSSGISAGVEGCSRSSASRSAYSSSAYSSSGLLSMLDVMAVSLAFRCQARNRQPVPRSPGLSARPLGGGGARIRLRLVVQEGRHGVVEFCPPRGVVDRRDGSGAGRGERPVPVSGNAGHLVVLPFLEVRAGQVNVVAVVVDILMEVRHVAGLKVDLVERPRAPRKPAAPMRDVGAHLLIRGQRDPAEYVVPRIPRLRVEH